jgi:uncharacterized repeat protein (TIGR03803 family)
LIKFNWRMKACGVFLLWATTAVALPAQTFTSLTSFNGMNGDGLVGTLIQATNGDLYGTAIEGGANGQFGTIFKATASGNVTTLYSFCAQTNCTDGENPTAGLVQATNGDFYGTTKGGGAAGYGTVFKISPSGALTTLHSFDNTDGANPYAGLVQGTNGKFYGTTFDGGGNLDSCPEGCGTVFSISASGTFTMLHSFDYADGYLPYAALVQGTDGNFYGTANGGAAAARVAQSSKSPPAAG